MAVSFSSKKESSPVFGTIYRPVAQVFFRHKTLAEWQPVTMIVDTGADYTLLPRFFSGILGIDRKADCREITSQGVGGKSLVYLTKTPVVIRIGRYERQILLGFLDKDLLPPILGRQGILDTFKVTFEKNRTTFS